MRMDRKVLDDCRESVNDDGVIDLDEARRIVADVLDGPRRVQRRGVESAVTDVELDTLRYAHEHFRWTEEADEWVYGELMAQFEGDTPAKTKMKKKKKKKKEEEEEEEEEAGRAKAKNAEEDEDEDEDGEAENENREEEAGDDDESGEFPVPRDEAEPNDSDDDEEEEEEDDDDEDPTRLRLRLRIRIRIRLGIRIRIRLPASFASTTGLELDGRRHHRTGVRALRGGVRVRGASPRRRRRGNALPVRGRASTPRRDDARSDGSVRRARRRVATRRTPRRRLLVRRRDAIVSEGFSVWRARRRW